MKSKYNKGVKCSRRKLSALIDGKLLKDMIALKDMFAFHRKLIGKNANP